ncbi:hypothetical protein CSC18_1224 [Klebsiella aerogenes]|nr:hypothetical protein CSC18_1224 [Klebsiella aerogenes]
MTHQAGIPFLLVTSVTSYVPDISYLPAIFTSGHPSGWVKD